MQPGFRIKARFFHELSQMLASGFTLSQALEKLSRGRGPSGVARNVFHALEITQIVPDAFAAAGFPQSDCAVIEAGASTGHLDFVLGQLAEHYDRLEKARSSIIAKSIYPLVVVHLAIFLLAIPDAIIRGSTVAYFWQVGTALIVLYGLLAVLGFGFVILGRLYASSVPASQGILAVPLVGAWMRTWTGSRFASVFSLFVRSGGSLLRGMELAGASSGSVLIRQTTLETIAAVRGGQSLADAIAGSPGLPEEIERAIQVGDHSGRLDEECQKAAEALIAKSMALLNALAEWFPRILYIGVLLYVAYRIISVMMGIGGEMNKLLEM